MAISAVGLKTHIWNNNLKSLLFVLCYPILITTTYLSLLTIAFLYITSELKGRSAATIELSSVFREIAFGYWYAPYVIVLGFLAVVYLYNRQRFDIARDMKAVTRTASPTLYETLENLCISRGLAMPYFFIQDHSSCNAYTTGLTPDTYTVVVTSGLVKELTDVEMEAVLAHELTHLINGDTRFVFLTGMVTHMFRVLSEMAWPNRSGPNEMTAFLNRGVSGGGVMFLLTGIVLKLSNIGALFAQMFISRKREYMADAGAVELTKNPQALISALKKVAGNTWGFYNQHAIKASLFNYSNFGEITSHPPIFARVAAIKQYAMREEKTLPWSRKGIHNAQASTDTD